MAGMKVCCSIMEGAVRKLRESPCKKLNGNQRPPVVNVRISSARRRPNSLAPLSYANIPDFGANPYNNYTGIIPPYTSVMQEANDDWVSFSSRSDTYSNWAGVSYNGSISVVGPGYALVKSGWPVGINADGTLYLPGQGTPGLNGFCIGASQLGPGGMESYANVWSGDGSAALINGGAGGQVQESYHANLSGAVDPLSIFNTVEQALVNRPWPLDWSSPAFGIGFHDAPLNQFVSNPADYTGAPDEALGGFPWGTMQAPPPIQWFGADINPPQMYYAASGWTIGDGAFTCFRGQAQLLDTQKTYYFIARYQEEGGQLSQYVTPAPFHWQARLSFVGEGWLVPVSGQAIVEAPFPASSPFPLGSINGYPIGTDMIFVVIGTDPAAWFSQWAAAIGGPSRPGLPQPSGFGDFFLAG